MSFLAPVLAMASYVALVVDAKPSFLSASEGVCFVLGMVIKRE